LYELYVLQEQEGKLRYRRVNDFRLNISPAKCITRTALYSYVEDGHLKECDTVWSDTKLRGITCYTSALMMEAVGSSETLEPIYQTACSHSEAPYHCVFMCVCACVLGVGWGAWATFMQYLG
jgi:hypothetical protein